MNFNRSLYATYEWITIHKNHFSISSKKHDSKESSIGAMKPLGEFVLTMKVLASLNFCKDECLGNVEWAWNEIRRGDLLIEILAVRPDLIILASLYANFEKLGFENKNLKDLVAFLLNTKGCSNIEFPHWRKLDLIHAEDSLGLRSFPESVEQGCWFHSQPEPWIMSDDIAYALTHDVFYLTDFGRQKKRLSYMSRKYLEEWLPGWLKIFSSQPNWDIYSELLMVFYCISEVDIPDLYIKPLVSAQEHSGMIPSPSGAGKQLLEFERKPSKEREKFLSNYHTCLVGLMALCMKYHPEDKKAIFKQ